MPKKAGIRQFPTFDWNAFGGGLDQGTPRYKLGAEMSPDCKNVILDERPGVILRRVPLVEQPSGTGTGENLFAFRRSNGSEYLLRSYHSGSTTLIEQLLSGGTWQELSYTGAGALGTVSGANLWTESSGHVQDFDDWIKVGDTIIFSTDTATYRAVTAVAATTITVGGAGLTNGAGASFKVRKNLGSNVFVNFVAYKDHAWWVSGQSNFLMCWNGTDVFENPNTWITGAPAFDTTLADTPKGEQIAVWNERMFIGNIADTEGDGDSLSRYTATSYEPANDPDGEVWNAFNEEPIFLNDGSTIRRVFARDDILYFFKDKRLCYLAGNTPDDWVLKSIDGAQGTIYGRLVQVIPSGPLRGHMLWLGEDDFYALAPRQIFPTRVGDYRLRTTLSNLARSIWNPDSQVWTSAADFAAGTNTNVDLTTVADAIRLKIDNGVDTTQAEFDAGAKTDVDTAKLSGSVFTSEATATFYISNKVLSGGTDRKLPSGSVTRRAQVFLTPSRRLLYPRIKVQLKKDGAPGGTVAGYLYSVGGNGEPLTLLETSANTYDSALDLTTSYVQKTFEFLTTLNSGKKYAFVIDGVTGDGSNWVGWLSGGTLAGGDPFRFDTDWDKEGGDQDIQITQYLTTGNIISATIDTGAASPTYGTLGATYTANGTTMTFETRTGAADPPTNAWTAVVPGEAITSASARYIQWRCTFTQTSAGDTGKLDDVTVNWGEAGSWTSAEVDAGAGVSTWGAFSSTATPGTNGTITYQIRFHATDVTLASFQAVTSGQSISSLTTPPAVTDRRFQVKASLSSTEPVASIPIIYDMTVNWVEGDSPTALPASEVYDDRIWLGLTLRGDTVPFFKLTYDRNGAWMPIASGADISVCGWTVYRDVLYGAQGDGAGLFSFDKEDTSYAQDADGIAPIYLTSPSFDLGDRDVMKRFIKVAVRAEKHQTGPGFTLQYAIDKDIDTGTWTSWTIDTAGTTGHEIDEHIPFPFEQRGKRIAFRVLQSAGYAFLGFTGLTLTYEYLTDVSINT